MKYCEAAVITVVIGYAGDAVLGNYLNWPNAGLICAIAVMGAFILRQIGNQSGK